MTVRELSWADAREAARALMEPIYTPGPGTLYVDPVGLEDEEVFIVFVGAREWMVGGDERYLLADTLQVMVWKETGWVDAFNPISEFDRMAHMTEVR